MCVITLWYWNYSLNEFSCAIAWEERDRFCPLIVVYIYLCCYLTTYIYSQQWLYTLDFNRSIILWWQRATAPAGTVQLQEPRRLATVEAQVWTPPLCLGPRRRGWLPTGKHLAVLYGRGGRRRSELTQPGSLPTPGRNTGPYVMSKSDDFFKVRWNTRFCNRRSLIEAIARGRIYKTVHYYAA